MLNIRTIQDDWKDYVDNFVWSFSRLNSYDNGCKYCWFENYANKRKDSVQNAFAEYGLLMHEILEGLDNGSLNLWDVLPRYEEEFAKVSEFPPLGRNNLRDIYYKQGIEYLSNYRFDDRYEVVSVEERVDVVIKGYKFTGFIDKLIRDKEDGKYIVLDHKSKSKFKSKREQKEYARQLYLYAEFVKVKYGEYPKMLIFNMFRHGLEVPIAFKEEDLEDAKMWMVEIIDRIKEGTEFPVSSDKFFREVLCGFREDENHKNGLERTLWDWTPPEILTKKDVGLDWSFPPEIKREDIKK